MKRLLKTCINISVVLFGGTVCVNGQVDLSKFEVGVNFSTYLYQGDLTPTANSSFKTPRFGFMVYANRALSSSFSLRTSLAVGSIKGDDGKFSDPSWRQQRNFAFRSPVLEISELLQWNVLGKNSGKLLGGFSPYLFGGLGVSFLNIQRDLSRYNAEYFADEPHVQAGLNLDLAKKLPRAIPVFPVGLGLRFSVSRKVSLIAESSLRVTTTDYLDGFSEAANSARKDQYSSHSVGIIYTFGKKNSTDCPTLPK